ncbi:hypothetical protein BG011_008544 [Mortierella polycephala]|uniref:Uncharacterized protein n=1 Tax=Mortierella polycephala TaxID=41804 RepID=A0A9P6U8E0_9FUNG|nr:hypothetical protein BG011_008544 [Mortierella polycephala]
MGSILPSMRFQSENGCVSLTALFLFLVMSMSFFIASCYMALAWWTRTKIGTAHILSSLHIHQRGEAGLTTKREPPWPVRTSAFLVSPNPRLWIVSATAASSLLVATLQLNKIRNGTDCSTLAPALQQFCWMTRAAVISSYLVSAVWMLWFGWCFYKTRDQSMRVQSSVNKDVQQASDQTHDVSIGMPPQSPEVREGEPGRDHDLEKAVSSSNSLPQSSDAQPEQNQRQKHSQQQRYQQRIRQSSIDGQTSQRLGDTTTASSRQQSVVEDINGHDSNSSLGLGIGICTKSFMDGNDFVLEADNTNSGKKTNNQKSVNDNNRVEIENGHNSIIPKSTSSGNLFCEDGRRHPIELDKTNLSLNNIDRIQYAETASLAPSERSVTKSTRSSSCGHQGFVTGSRSGRLRDHAKIFPVARSSTSNINEAMSNRGTPLIRSASREILYGPPSTMMLNSSGLFSPNVATPTTPLSRGGIGYMGKHTMKTLNSMQRSSSVGFIATVNKINASEVISRPSSVQGSPMTGQSYYGPSTPVMDLVGTPNSLKSYRSMSSFFGPESASFYPQTQAEMSAAEQSMDEHLRAIRRRSFVAGVMRSPAFMGSGDVPSRMSTEELIAADEIIFGSGSPSVGTALQSTGSFRMSFSSPNLGAFRRRSSLGLKSILNSIVSSPFASDSENSSSIPSSGVSSPRLENEIINSPNSPNDSCASSLATHWKLEQTVSAQELLRAEYGGLFLNLPRPNSAQTLNEADVNFQPNMTPGGDCYDNGQGARPRSNSVSSAGTSRSGSTAKTSSSASSHSTTSTLTSLSNEDKIALENETAGGSKKREDPSSSFMNRILVGSHHQQHRQSHRRVCGGSSDRTVVQNGLDCISKVKKSGRGIKSGSTTPTSKRFLSQGDLSQYCWDYRKEMPVD